MQKTKNKKNQKQTLQKKHSGTNTYVNYRLKHVLSFFPWPRLSNRQSHVNLWSLLSVLITYTYRGSMQKNLSLFHYFKANRRRWLAEESSTDYSLSSLHFSASTTRAGKKRGLSRLQGCRLHLTGLPHGCRGWSSSLSPFSMMLNEGINKWVGLYSSRHNPEGFLSLTSGTRAQIFLHGGGKPTIPACSTFFSCIVRNRLSPPLQGFLK